MMWAPVVPHSETGGLVHVATSETSGLKAGTTGFLQGANGFKAGGRFLQPSTPRGFRSGFKELLSARPSFVGLSCLVGFVVGSSARLRKPRRVVQEAIPSWQQTMLRIKDPAESLSFYQGTLGMRLLDKLDFESMGFSLYFLASLPPDQKSPEPGTAEAHIFLWTFPGTTLELTHNYGTEEKVGPVYHPGNAPRAGDRRDGFGHVAFAVEDVYATSAELDSAGVKFQKKPDEGRMKGLAFALDPDGYWVELVRGGGAAGKYTLAQTMLRIKNPQKSLDFYTKHLGMTLLQSQDCGDFTLYFLGSVPEGATSLPPGRPVLELTHNHGTEDEAEFEYLNGNESDRKGFGHVGFLVDDVYETCEALGNEGYAMQKAPDTGTMKGLAFFRDPDGYWVEIIKRGGYDADATPYFFSENK
eukprot:CAMPEP_0115082668 /NCGR_PEP_ID=MMETSP0227-20121206/20048_1 /TAXON_ID=89957 /ORGANISM="Polarella glacialis, Strain CCMP 1383" /LENGTH=413 /DNA_ID=CAMNT_0002470821 /DNA_START=56 /DNA_END=1297 /DNA_ORIENTATION=+